MTVDKLSKTYRYVNVLLACFQNMTLGGIIFGWASISGTLLISSESAGGAGLSSDYVHMMFVIASFFNFLGPLVLGAVLDIYGPKKCSLLSISIIGIGCAMFGVSDKNKLDMFMPGMCLIALGGPGAQSAIIHLSNLFPERKATITAFITGSFQLSFIIFLIFDQLWFFAKWSYSQLFLGYCVIVGMNLLVSAVFWPDEPYSYEDQFISLQDSGLDLVEREMKLTHQPPVGPIRAPSVFVHHTQHHQQHRLTGYPAGTTAAHTHPNHTAHTTSAAAAGEEEGFLVPPTTSQSSSQPLEPAIELKEGTLYAQVTSEEFFSLTFWFLVNTFWANFYIGSFEMQLGDCQLFSVWEQHFLGRVFTIAITLGIIVIPLVGWLMDIHGFPATSAFCICCGIIWGVLLLANSSTLLFVSFVFYSAYRTSLFTFFFAYLADSLGYKYFGMLAGIIFFLAGLLGILQYPLAQYVAGTCHDDGADQETCSNGHWMIVNVISLLMITSTLHFSYQDYRRRHVPRLGERTYSHSMSSMSTFQAINLQQQQTQQQAQLCGSGGKGNSIEDGYGTL